MASGFWDIVTPTYLYMQSPMKSDTGSKIPIEAKKKEA